MTQVPNQVPEHSYDRLSYLIDLARPAGWDTDPLQVPVDVADLRAALAVVDAAIAVVNHGVDASGYQNGPETISECSCWRSLLEALAVLGVPAQ